MDILDAYVGTGPDPQAVLDIFAGEWSSQVPAASGLLTTPGPAPLFEDPRIEWLADVIGGFEGRNILELGPLEAGHTYMMHERGAASLTAVEANTRSYLKCLCIQQVFDLKRVRFVFADAIAYVEKTTERFDLCLASGLLYHTVSPVSFIRDICQRADRLFVWTHVFDPAMLADEAFASQFDAPRRIEFEGHGYTVARRRYGEALAWAGFCGGSKPWAYWLTRQSLEDAIRAQGFDIVATGFDITDHVNGPSVALVAERRPTAG